MTNKLFLIIVLICLRMLSSEQNITGSEIYLHAETTGGGEFFIDIISSNDNTKIVFKLKDSVRNSELEKDINTIKIRQFFDTLTTLNPSNDTVKTFLNALHSIYTAYTVYRTDSLILLNAQNEDYCNLIHEVVNAPTKVLENYYLHRVVLDGTQMYFTLTNNGITRTAFANTPSLTSYTLLYKLITQTTGLYRKTKTNNFLSKSRTCGY